MARVAIYAEDMPGMPADAQVEALSRYCRRRGWGEPVVYRDPPVRPAGETRLSARLRLLQAALRRRHDVLCVWRLAALGARNLNGLVLTLAAILRAGVTVVAVGDGIDTGRGRQAARMVEALANYERATNRRSGWVRPDNPCKGCPCRPVKRLVFDPSNSRGKRGDAERRSHANKADG